MKKKIIFFVGMAVFILSGCRGHVMPHTKQAAAPTLYERLGGVYGIAPVVEDFIDRVYVNDALNANPNIKEARDRVPLAGLKFQVTAQVCQVTGGPPTYYGRTMKDAHKHLNITAKEWQLMLDDFKTSLDTFDVPDAEQQELIDIVNSTRADIVIAK